MFYCIKTCHNVPRAGTSPSTSEKVHALLADLFPALPFWHVYLFELTQHGTVVDDAVRRGDIVKHFHLAQLDVWSYCHTVSTTSTRSSLASLGTATLPVETTIDTITTASARATLTTSTTVPRIYFKAQTDWNTSYFRFCSAA